MASISEAKNTLSALLDLVRAGETVVIMDRGRPVAQLGALPQTGDMGARLDRLERAGSLRRGTGKAIEVLSEPAGRVLAGHGTAALDALEHERSMGR